ncbi:HNH endonuclease [Lactobacillus johnsonii]|uniref:HNH endonuclease signature motif containing protein n=1 Tax=Lactobacillus johnsonii TaxID=33959 RepID=UPI001302F6AC|nr:HNH endonuclease signature motif containing protein [Lactobacillus johnsonii]QGY95910.1 HNH endonuclease [Lactobacillus johnsonii]
MKLQCASCGLRLDSLHFKQEGLMNPKLTSICDICLTRNLDAENYENPVVESISQVMLYSFVGKKNNGQIKPDSLKHYIVDNNNRRQYESFIQDYDGNEVALQQISRREFNLAIIKSEDNEIDYVPENNVDFAVNMKKMGIEVDFSLNEVDFVDRERIRHKYNYRCQYCGRRGTSVDHKDPVSLSHDNSFDNLILSCSECNKIKSNMPYQLFVKLNDQLTIVNKKLVKYEDALANLKEEFQAAKRDLAGKVHLKGIVNDPELNAIRKQNKKLQDAIDSLQSDYGALRNERKTYFDIGWKLEKERENSEII